MRKLFLLKFFCAVMGIVSPLHAGMERRQSLESSLAEYSRQAARKMQLAWNDASMETRLIFFESQFRSENKNVKSPAETAEALRRYFFEKLRFGVDVSDPEGKKPENLLLYSVLERRKGTCLGLSLAFLCLAERLDLPFYGVELPGHFFIRYEGQGVRFNVENTDGGRAWNDGKYWEYFGIPVSPLYLKNLSQDQVICVFLNNLGKVYRAKGLSQDAVLSYEAAVRYDPGNSGAYVNLGVLCGQQEKWQEEIQFYQKALTLYPEDVEALSNLGGAYRLRGLYEKASEFLKKALVLRPEFAEAHYNFGGVLEAQGFSEEAILEYEAALRFNPRFAPSHAQLAGIYYRKKNYALAWKHCEAAMSLGSTGGRLRWIRFWAALLN